MSSGSSRGSLGSLSASSKSSLNSLSFPDIYLSTQSSVDSNQQDLQRRVDKLLQGHGSCISPIYEVGGSTENIGVTSALLPPKPPTMPACTPTPSPTPTPTSPPSYEQHLERQHRHHPGLHCRQLDHSNLEARLSELTTDAPPCTACRPGAEVCDPRARSAQDSALDTPASNPPLSPISETSSGVCNPLSGGASRSVSAAVSDESVAGDSGVFEASIKR